MKILFVATVRSHIGQFHMPFISELKKQGHIVDAAFKDNSEQKKGLDLSIIDKVYEVPFSRSPYSLSNVKAYFILKKIINTNHYDAIHCHTPMGAVITRLAAKKARKKGTKVIYTAHGFHFYKGASKLNWILYYNIEKYLAKYTDCLITINKEDYEVATFNNFRANKIYKVNGVGVDLSQFKHIDNEEKCKLREKYGYCSNDFIMIYPADFCHRKNHSQILRAVYEVKKIYPNIKLLLPGANDYMDEAIGLINELNIKDEVDILGYRRDIYNLVELSDISVSSSRQEGLPINLIEAMAVGNAIVATDVRGNNDVVIDGENGFLVPLDDYKSMADKIIELINHKNLLVKFANTNNQMVKKYSLNEVNKELNNIYSELGLI